MFHRTIPSLAVSDPPNILDSENQLLLKKYEQQNKKIRHSCHKTALFPVVLLDQNCDLCSALVRSGPMQKMAHWPTSEQSCRPPWGWPEGKAVSSRCSRCFGSRSFGWSLWTAPSSCCAAPCHLQREARAWGRTSAASRNSSILPTHSLLPEDESAGSSHDTAPQTYRRTL